MGENIDDCPYASGASCGVCSASLFGGQTPLYVRASFTDIESCPGGSGKDWNGAFLLTQNAVLPCIWIVDTGDALITYQLTPQPGLGIREHVGLKRDIFFDILGVACGDEFANNFVTCGPINGARFGTGIITWGCSIHA